MVRVMMMMMKYEVTGRELGLQMRNECCEGVGERSDHTIGREVCAEKFVGKRNNLIFQCV